MKKFIKKNFGYILFILGFTVCLSYCTFFSPIANYNPTEEELRQMAIEYDRENNTNYAQYWEE